MSREVPRRAQSVIYLNSESKWRAWLATQPPAPTAGEIATRDVETHPAFVSLRRFWTTGEYEQPAELCNDKSTLYRYVWKL